MQLSVRDIAPLLKVSEKTIYRWIQNHRIPFCRVGDAYRFNRAEIIEWATAQRIEVSPELLREPLSAGPLPSISEALEAGGIYYRVKGSSRNDVLREVVGLMRLPEGVDSEFLGAVLIAREDLASTGVGDGIAIPHPRRPLVLHVARPSLTLCFLEEPVDFGAMDGQPVHTLFTVLTPTVRSHLHVLSRLAFLLHQDPVRRVLREQALREVILQTIQAAEGGLAPGPEERP